MVVGPAPVRRRRRLRLADVPVGAKLGIILIVPMVGLFGLAAVAASVYAAQGGRIGDLRGAIAAGAEAGRVTDGLQRERLAIARLLFGGAGGADQARDAYATEAARTDAAIGRFRTRAAQVGRSDPARGQLDRAIAGLDALGALRTEAAGRTPDAPGQLYLLRYRQIAADLIQVQQGLADRPAPGRVNASVRAAGWLAVGKEELAVVQVGVVRALGTGELSPADREGLITHRAASADALRRFAAAAPASWRDRLERVLAGVDVAAAAAAADRVLLAPAAVPAADGDDSATPTAGAAAAPRVDLGEFGRLSVAQLDGLDEVGAAVARDTAAIVTDARDRQNRTLLLGVALVLAIAAFSVGIVVAVTRSMAGALRALQVGAWRVAYERLPQTVRTLQDADPATAHQLVAAPADLAVHGHDEIGRVTEAFNAVQREAVRAAAEQAALRAGFSTVFVNLARRSMRLVDALIERLDGAERDEADPDRLALLFTFDHLATRMRHHNQSLLVLAGVDGARAHPDPVALIDVLRAAQSQIQQYERVEYGRVDEDVAIDPDAVDGVVHLLAELFDNAARHSPPGQPVVVDGRRTGDGAVVQVSDRGDGLDLEELETLNDRLLDPPPLDVADSRRMGLAVVARLAARLGVAVSLQPAAGEGLAAVVRIPADLLSVASPVLQAPVAARQVLPRPLERSPALPGAEPVDVPVPRTGGAFLPVVPGQRRPGHDGAGPDPVTPDGPTVEARAFGALPPDDLALPRRAVGERTPPRVTADGAPPIVEPDEVRDLLSSYQHALGRFGSAPVPASQEGRSPS